MKKIHYLPDIFNSIVAFGIGLSLALFFHAKWYYGGWMSFFGDPPAENPAYSHFVHLFEMAPYIASGLGSGMIAGIGSQQLPRIFMRLAGILLLFLLLFSRNQNLALFAFLPASMGSFFVSLSVSAIYSWLLNNGSNAKRTNDSN
jgi:hypothetical protein